MFTKTKQHSAAIAQGLVNLVITALAASANDLLAFDKNGEPKVKKSVFGVFMTYINGIRSDTNKVRKEQGLPPLGRNYIINAVSDDSNEDVIADGERLAKLGNGLRSIVGATGWVSPETCAALKTEVANAYIEQTLLASVETANGEQPLFSPELHQQIFSAYYENSNEPVQPIDVG